MQSHLRMLLSATRPKQGERRPGDRRRAVAGRFAGEGTHSRARWGRVPGCRVLLYRRLRRSAESQKALFRQRGRVFSGPIRFARLLYGRGWQGDFGDGSNRKRNFRRPSRRAGGVRVPTNPGARRPPKHPSRCWRVAALTGPIQDQCPDPSLTSRGCRCAICLPLRTLLYACAGASLVWMQTRPLGRLPMYMQPSVSTLPAAHGWASAGPATRQTPRRRVLTIVRIRILLSALAWCRFLCRSCLASRMTRCVTHGRQSGLDRRKDNVEDCEILVRRRLTIARHPVASPHHVRLPGLRRDWFLEVMRSPSVIFRFGPKARMSISENLR
jgi:hypothetical protein